MGREGILITGHLGLLGSAICNILSKAHSDNPVYSVGKDDGDLNNIYQTREIFRNFKPTYVIHCAANSNGYYRNSKHNLDLFLLNQEILKNLFECCIQFNIKKCIICLCSKAFPNNSINKMNESMLHTGPPPQSVMGFAYANRFADILCQCYNQNQSNTLFVPVILCNMYGPHDNFNIHDGHVIAALIHKAYLALENCEPLFVLGSGNPVRQFLYSEDAARIIINVLHEYDCGDPLIISVDETNEVSIKDVAKIIVSYFETKGNSIRLQFDDFFLDGENHKTLDNSKMKSLWPAFKFTSIKEGIKFTIDWFKKNYYQARM